MEAFIQFLIRYNEKIIYVSVGVVCLLSAVVVWWQVFGKKGLKTGASSDLDLEQIEETLKKILNQTNTAIQNVPMAADGAGGVATISGIVDAAGNPIQDVAGIKTELETRAKIIEELKIQVAAASNDTSSAELLAKIRDLEGKLAEYEIIEDDIADLSLFKDENAKLKKELEGIKRAGPEMVDQFAAAVAEANTVQALSALTAEAKVAEEPEALLAESESILESALEPVVSVEVEPEVVAEVEPEVAAAIQVEPEAKADIFAEFEGEENENMSDPLSALGDIDPDRMLDELKDLNADMELGADSLDEAPDIDKMANEAVDLPKKG